MRDSVNDEWGIKPLQNCILNIANYIDTLCRDNGIVYYLMGGSALGAVRHEGFIPWDDDLDIFMTLENYEKFRSIFEEKGDKEQYYLQEFGLSNGRITTAKIRFNQSTFIEDVLRDQDIHHGVFIDIFILHNCPKPSVQRLWQYLWCRYLVVKSMANRKNMRGSFIRKTIVWLFKLFPKRFLLNFALKQIYKFENSPSDEFCHFLGRASIRRGIYKKEQFGKPRRVPFETLYLNVPSQVEEYLKERFGDYMKVPSIDEIRHFQHTSEWSVVRSFTRLKTGSFSDEKYLI